MRKQTVLQVLWLSGALVLPVSALATEADMAFHGTLIEPPPCTIDDGNQVEVDFGERVGVSKVDGVNYRQKLNYQISCEGEPGSWALKLSLSGTPASFNGDALQSNKADLAVQLYQAGKPFKPNSRVNISLTSLPLLEAVPVKRAGSELTEGAFEVWATLRADYE